MIKTSSDTYENNRREISLKLHEIEGIKFGEFILTSGKKSPYYIDLRIVPSYPEFFEEIAGVYAEIICEKIKNSIDKIAGVPTSGLPIATLVSHKLKKPLIYARSGRKLHGRGKKVEGLLKKGDNVAIIDDIATTGGSIKEAAKTIREEGGIVRHTIVLLDREEGAERNLEADEIRLHRYIRISELIKNLKKASILDNEKYSRIMDYIRGSE